MKSAEKIDYGGWPNSYRLSNDVVELVVTTDVGPRLIHFSFKGEDNEFLTIPEMIGLSGGSEWRVYGGHRFWHAPDIQFGPISQTIIRLFSKSMMQK